MDEEVKSEEKVSSIGNVEFANLIKENTNKYNYTPFESDEDEIGNDALENKKYEVFFFANFDICNFTKYKRENRNWTALLKDYLDSIKNQNSSEFLTQFWKFNGDSLTFKFRVLSVNEICHFIFDAQQHLDNLQAILNKEKRTRKKVYVKASAWIAGFPSELDSKTNDNEYSTNNRKIIVNGAEEFVGENIDEGFRLCECSKAGKLVVDPKIVAIIHLYNYICDRIKVPENNSKSALFDLLDKIENNLNVDSYMRIFLPTVIAKIKSVVSTIADVDYSSFINDFNPVPNEVTSKLYLMEYRKCKGIWDDRDYPIFWYIEDPKNCELIYDEIVNGKRLRDHDLFKSITKTGDIDSNEFDKGRSCIYRVFAQNYVDEVLKELVFNLLPMPFGHTDRITLDKANLYFMVACVVTKDNEDVGVLIFRRNQKNRIHLKNVWDLVPIKHSRAYSREGFVISSYLKVRLSFILNLSEKISKLIQIQSDTDRQSIIPYAMCNIYRRESAHNDVLCVAELDAGEYNSIDDLISDIKSEIVKAESPQFDDVFLVRLNDIEMDNSINHGDYLITSLEPSQMENDARAVSLDKNYVSFPLEDNAISTYGISFLGLSIRQILEKRNRERN